MFPLLIVILCAHRDTVVVTWVIAAARSPQTRTMIHIGLKAIGLLSLDEANAARLGELGACAGMCLSGG